jgi:hypothetical protein
MSKNLKQRRAVSRVLPLRTDTVSMRQPPLKPEVLYRLMDDMSGTRNPRTKATAAVGVNPTGLDGDMLCP